MAQKITTRYYHQFLTASDLSFIKTSGSILCGLFYITESVIMIPQYFIAVKKIRKIASSTSIVKLSPMGRMANQA
jgi:hypothetical protein